MNIWPYMGKERLRSCYFYGKDAIVFHQDHINSSWVAMSIHQAIDLGWNAERVVNSMNYTLRHCDNNEDLIVLIEG